MFCKLDSGLPRPVDPSSVDLKPVKDSKPRTMAFLDQLKNVSAQKAELRPKLPTTGHAFLDFELNGKQVEF